jgi:hypothetical protein
LRPAGLELSLDDAEMRCELRVVPLHARDELLGVLAADEGVDGVAERARRGEGLVDSARRKTTTSEGWGLLDERKETVADPPSEVLDVETPFRDGNAIVSHLMEIEARLNLVLQRNHVVLIGLHGLFAARTLVDDRRRVGHDLDLIPVRCDAKSRPVSQVKNSPLEGQHKRVRRRGSLRRTAERSPPLQL